MDIQLDNELTYLLTPRSRVLLEKLTGFAANQEIPRIYGTRRFITAFKSARHLSLFWARLVQSSSLPIRLPEEPFQYYPPISSYSISNNIWTTSQDNDVSSVRTGQQRAARKNWKSLSDWKPFSPQNPSPHKKFYVFLLLVFCFLCRKTVVCTRFLAFLRLLEHHAVYRNGHLWFHDPTLMLLSTDASGWRTLIPGVTPRIRETAKSEEWMYAEGLKKITKNICAAVLRGNVVIAAKLLCAQQMNMKSNKAIRGGNKKKRKRKKNQQYWSSKWAAIAQSV